MCCSIAAISSLIALSFSFAWHRWLKSFIGLLAYINVYLILQMLLA
jgi:hypothetical protein